MLCGLLQERPLLPPALPTGPLYPAQGGGSPDLKASGQSWVPGSQALMGPMAEASWYWVSNRCSCAGLRAGKAARRFAQLIWVTRSSSRSRPWGGKTHPQGSLPLGALGRGRGPALPATCPEPAHRPLVSLLDSEVSVCVCVCTVGGGQRPVRQG